MTTYRIEMLNDFRTLMVKTSDEMKMWIEKYNVTDKNGGKVDLRKAKGGMVVRVNGKMLRVHKR